MKRGVKYWLCWIGVLPLSLIAAMLVTFPLHWILYRTLSGGDAPFITPYPEMPEQILSPLVSALVMVWVASQVAPEYKFKTAFVVTVLWVFAAGAFFALGYVGYQLEQTKLNLPLGGIPVLAGVLGAGLGLYFTWKREIRPT